MQNLCVDEWESLTGYDPSWSNWLWLLS